MRLSTLWGRCSLPCVMCLHWMAVKFAVARSQSVIVSKIKIHPAAERVFPNAQLSAPCAIITVGGLGPLDGDFTLVDDDSSLPSSPTKMIQRRPVWIGASTRTEHLALSYQPEQGVWTIGGAYGLTNAFVRVDSTLPPAQSAMWSIFRERSSRFEKVDNVVTISCPACTAVSVSMLPGALAECDGPYRSRTASRDVGVFAWSHVSDERCTMLHDKHGNSVVTMEGPAVLVRDSSAASVARGYPIRKEWWADLLKGIETLSSLGENTSVVCSSAGQTTRIVFDLVKSQQAAVIPPVNVLDPAGEGVDAFNAPASSSSKLTSRQDGSIVSSTHSFFHIHVSGAADMWRNRADDDGVADFQLSKADGGGRAATTSLRARITVNGNEALVSPSGVSIDGIGEGTNVFEICLFETQADGLKKGGRATDLSVCVAESVLIVEVFSAETTIIQQRNLNEIMVSSGVGADDTKEGEDGNDPRRIIFITDLKIVDGFKLSTLHLLKNLPRTFQASTLDLSCAFGDLPMMDLYNKEGVEVSRLCIQPPIEMWNYAQQQGTTMSQLMYAALVDALTWEDVTSGHPDVARSLLDLHRHLSVFDVLVMSNGGRDDDAYLLHVARLAGVSIRVVNLGATVGGYVSPFFTGATALIGPSHFVAHNPAVSRNAAHLSVKVCHPVMDAARVLNSARSCRSIGGQPTGDPPEPVSQNLNAVRHVTGEGRGGVFGRKTRDDGGIPHAKFVMVGRMAPEKTPGMFVRAMAVLQRRRVAVGGGMAEAVVVGDGLLLGHMKGLARDLDAGVRFTGFLSVDDVPCEVQRATALVLPSLCPETFGMVGPEAMLLGVPLVTFGYGGSAELVRHMENGLLVREPTPRALADAMELLAGDSALRDRLGKQARQDALRALSLREMVACHVEEFLDPPTR
ncbi:unnamed protein product, partial [Scytosiphon promiscuus]